jgi:hypothetical protein
MMLSVLFQVTSEDTVLYTAQAYADKLAASGSSSQLAVDALAPLVRCPHLSQFWLSASVLSDDADKLLLWGLQLQLKRLLLLKPACQSVRAEDINTSVSEAPASWLLPVRDLQLVSSQVIWNLDVAAIKKAAQDSANQQAQTSLCSLHSCLLGGVWWGMLLKCTWDASTKSSSIGLYADAHSLPAGSFCACTFTLKCPSSFANWATHVCTGSGHFAGHTRQTLGRHDFFTFGPMSGGFDEARWAANYLPASGSIVLQLAVNNVGG